MKLKIIEKELMDPLAEANYSKQIINPIPNNIGVITLLDNTKPGADIVLRSIQEHLRGKEFINIKKPAGAPATIQQLEKAVQADLTIIALGDCGSCSSWVILDAIRLENMGIPTISICSHVFSDFAHRLASSHGAADLRLITVEHPIAGLSEEEINTKIKPILPMIRFTLHIP